MDATWQTRDRMAHQSAASASDVVGIVLAAGRSSRMGPGHNKLVTELEGKSLVIYSVDAALAADLTEVWVVTGHDAERVRAVLAGRDVRFVHNPDHASGLASSLRSALLAIGENRAGFLVLLGDMPRVSADDLRKLVAAFEHSGRRSICVPEHAGRRGNPVLWPASERAALLGLSGDVGGRELLRARDAQLVRVPIDHDGVLLDVDTPEALATVATRAKR